MHQDENNIPGRYVFSREKNAKSGQKRINDNLRAPLPDPEIVKAIHEGQEDIKAEE